MVNLQRFTIGIPYTTQFQHAYAVCKSLLDHRATCTLCTDSHHAFNTISRKRNTISRKRDIISRKRDIISRKRDIISRKRDIISRKRDIISRKRDIISRKRDNISRKRNKNNSHQVLREPPYYCTFILCNYTDVDLYHRYMYSSSSSDHRYNVQTSSCVSIARGFPSIPIAS